MFTRLTKLALFTLGIALLSVPAFSQTPPDVPRDHWAYPAVEELASKGLIKGYPPDGKFFGARTVTRYEMATIIQRVLARVNDLLAQKQDRGATQPGVTPRQLADIQKLVDEFRTEQTVIGTDMTEAKADIAALQVDVAALRGRVDQNTQGVVEAKQGVQEAIDAIHEQAGRVDATNRTLNAHKIGGYLQARFETFEPRAGDLFTSTAAGGTGQTPSARGRAVGGPKYGFLVRRARIKLTGNITQRTGYGLQVDFPSTGAFNLKDAFVRVADLPVKDPSGIFGQFLTPFGFELNYSSAARESPERALAFPDSTASIPISKTSTAALGGTVTPGSVLPLFQNQEYDVGAGFVYTLPSSPQTRFTLAAINGEGSVGGGIRNLNRGIDAVARAETTLFSNSLGVGVSGYYGSVPVRVAPPTGGTPAAFRNAYRELLGADVRYTAPWGTNFKAEYVGGLLEATPDRSLYLEGNHVYSWYFQAWHPITKKVVVVAKCEEYDPVSQGTVTVGGLRRMDLVRKIAHAGVLYQLDSATRLRLWYERGLNQYDRSASTGPF